ncbi:MAG: serine/threonine-protein kinase [Planctomycetota bacterium]
MSEPPSLFEQLVGKIADGEAIDWDAVQAEGTLTPDEVRALRSLDAIRHLQDSAPSVSLKTGFDILDPLGSGGSAQIYRAVDRNLGRQVALKVIRQGDGTEAWRHDFLREARLLASVEHSNIIRIYSVEEHEGEIQLVLELIDGQSLEDFLKQTGPLESREAARIGLDLCRALAAVHAKDLIHLDIKPANVMRETGGRIVLLDFGVARRRDLAGDTPPTVRGTPLYLAPEQLTLGGKNASPRTDLYALGVSLYTLVTAHHPFEGATADELYSRIFEADYRPLLDLRPDLPPTFVHLVKIAMARDPADRFESAGQMAEALAQLLEETIFELTPRTASLTETSVATPRAADIEIRPMDEQRFRERPGLLVLSSRSVSGHERRDLARVAFERGPIAFLGEAGPVTSIIVQGEPTLDDLLAASILSRQIAGEKVPAGLLGFAQYAAAVRAGIRSPGGVPLEESLEGCFAAMRRNAGDDLIDPAVWERLFERWTLLEDSIFAAAAEGLPPEECIRRNPSVFARERAYLEHDRRVFEEDTRRGLRWKLTLAGAPPGDGLLLVQPKSLLFKHWSREPDPDTGRPRALLLAVLWTESRWVFSTNPVDRISLRGLCEELQAAEDAAAEPSSNPAQWFDGSAFTHSLIAAPQGGTTLPEEDVLLTLWRWTRAPWLLRNRAIAKRKICGYLSRLRW